MENSNKYNRSFLIFSQEDAGFGAGSEPTGHIKIEVKEGKGKLYSQIHNLNLNLKNTIYKLYLVRCEKNELDFLKVGSFDVKGIKTEISWNFNPRDVELTGIGIDSFNVFVVAAVDVEGKKRPAFPLVAYRGNKTKWKERFVKAINEPMSEKIIEKEAQIETQNYHKQIDDLKIENTEEDQEDQQCQESQKYQEYQVHNDMQNEIDPRSSNADENMDSIQEHNCATCFADCWARNFTAMGDNEMNYSSQANNDEHIEFDKLKDILSKFYESIYPFGGGNKYYRWWRIKNPTTLNNIFHQCNIKNPVFYNPKLLMAFYKYRHLILGIYNDESMSKEYIVIGIPGIYGLDEIPMRVVGRWAQTEGGGSRYGAFGYWLLYIDTKTGKLIY